MASSSQSSYRRLSVLLSEIPEGFYKPNFLEKGVQLWLCMEDKLSQEDLAEQQLQEAEESGELKSRKPMTFKQTNGLRGVPNC